MAMLFVALGSNLGQREAMLDAALAALDTEVGPVVLRSSYYETAPEGFDSVHPFLNAVAALRTTLPPERLLALTQSIERRLGREQKSSGVRYADRPIDIDLLQLDDVVLNTPTLALPHGRLHRRLFVLLPLVEVAPQLRHPVFGLTARELLERRMDSRPPAIERLNRASAIETADIGALTEQLTGRLCPDLAERLPQLLAQPATRLYALRRPGGYVAGMATLSLTPLPSGRKAWVDDVVIDETLRHQGWGRRLVEHVVAEARRLGADSLALTSRPERKAANRLYRSLGFEPRTTNVYRLGLR